MYFKINASKGPAFYVVGVNDGYGVSQEVASSIARAVGNSKGKYPDGSSVFRTITGAQATNILNTVKSMRTRNYEAIAKAVGREVGPDFKHINDDLDALTNEIQAMAEPVSSQEVADALRTEIVAAIENTQLSEDELAQVMEDAFREAVSDLTFRVVSSTTPPL